MNYFLVSNTFFLRFRVMIDIAFGDDKLYVSLFLEYYYFRVY